MQNIRKYPKTKTTHFSDGMIYTKLIINNTSQKVWRKVTKTIQNVEERLPESES